MKLHEINILRRVFLPLLKRFSPGDISINHPLTKDKVKLHFFRHKGYWYHRARREEETMTLFKRIIKPGDTVLEVGGHIGYISLYFSSLIGNSGQLIVFEPGINNLPYIKSNLKGKPNITLVEKAVSNQVGVTSFFIDNLTGQNNSLNKDYEVFKNNRKAAFTESAYKEVSVPTTTLDFYCEEKHIIPNFIKMDIEGAELLALNGMNKIFKESSPAMMIEITDSKEKIFEILTKAEYVLFNERRSLLSTPEEISHNTFCLHQIKHKVIIQEIFTN